MNSILQELFDDLTAFLAGRTTSDYLLEMYPELAPLAEKFGGLLQFAQAILPALESVVFGQPSSAEHADVLHVLAAAASRRFSLDHALPTYEPEVQQRIERLLQALVDTLQAVVPDGITLARAGLHAGAIEDGRLVRATVYCHELDAWGIEMFVSSLTNLVQDHVSIETTWPWPSWPGAPTSMAEPESAIENGVLTIWFGDARAPLVACAPISLDGIL